MIAKLADEIYNQELDTMDHQHTKTIKSEIRHTQGINIVQMLR